MPKTACNAAENKEKTMIEKKQKIKTEKIYDKEPLRTEFEAEVLSCIKNEKNLYETVLDRTAFFPTGGGQPCDTGRLISLDDGTEVNVTEVVSDGENIIHITDSELKSGSKIKGILDRDKRISRMEAHSGEHIVSALIFRHYGFNNVGFHMGSEDVTADFDGVISDEELAIIEREANEIVRANLPIKVVYPDEKELLGLEYRSKLELTSDVRIVCIGDIDKCACCAPHLESTGQIGIIRLIRLVHYKGGIRVHMLCGGEAIKRIQEEGKVYSSLCAMLSSKPEKLFSSVERLASENRLLKNEICSLNDYVNTTLCSTAEEGKPLCLFDEREDVITLRKLAVMMSESLGEDIGVFGGKEGNYKMIISGKDIKQKFSELSKLISCRGGGNDNLICGSSSSNKADIISAWNKIFLPNQKT